MFSWSCCDRVIVLRYSCTELPLICAGATGSLNLSTRVPSDYRLKTLSKRPFVSGLAQSRTRSRSIGHVTHYGDVTASTVRTNESTRRQHRPPTHAVTPRSVAVRAPAPRTCAASSIVYFVLCLSSLLFTCVQFIRWLFLHPQGRYRKQTWNQRYGDNRKMAAGFAYRI